MTVTVIALFAWMFLPNTKVISRNMNTKLFIGNLASSATSEAIQEIFAPHGSVCEVRLVKNRITARSRGFAFVTMTTPEGAQKAIQALHGTIAEGRFINVREAHDGPEDRGPGWNHIPRREFRKLY